MDKKKEYSPERLQQEEEIRKTQEIIINEDLINQVVEDNQQLENSKKASKKGLFGLIFVFINIILVVILGFTSFQGEEEGASFSKMFETWMKPENVGYWFIAMGLGFLSLIAESLKFFVMIKKTTNKNKVWLSIKTAVLGKYYDNITPLGSGGQIFQLYYLKKGGVPGAESMYLPVASFFLNQLAFLFLCIMAFIANTLVNHQIINNDTLLILAYIGAAFSIAIPVGIFIASFMPKLREKIIRLCVRVSFRFKIIKNKGAATRKANKLVNDYRRSLMMLAKSPITLSIIVILSFIYQLSLCSIPYFVVRACGIETNYFFSLCTCVFVYAAISFTPTPGNSGAAEVSFAKLFIVLSNVPGVSEYWAMAYWRFCCYFLIVLLGICFVIGGIISSSLQRKKNIQLADEALNQLNQNSE